MIHMVTTLQGVFLTGNSVRGFYSVWIQTLIYVLLCFLFSYTCQHNSLSPFQSLTGKELVYLEKGHADWENLSQNHQFPPNEVTVLPKSSPNRATPKTKTHKPF